MELPDEVRADVRLRLRRAGGQVAAVERMLDEGRDCREVITQLTAAIRALEQVGFKIVANGMVWCVRNPEEAAAEGLGPDEVERLFLRLA
jgi:DNA-binding FrmR family transcriptional regulator